MLRVIDCQTLTWRSRAMAGQALCQALLVCTKSIDFDFGIPDPYPMDWTKCLHKLTGSVLHKRGPDKLFCLNTLVQYKEWHSDFVTMKLKLKLSREARSKFSSEYLEPDTKKANLWEPGPSQEPDAKRAKLREQGPSQEPDAKRSKLGGRGPSQREARRRFSSEYLQVKYKAWHSKNNCDQT